MYPEAPPRKVKRRKLKCHCCGKRQVYYLTCDTRTDCVCDACKKSFDPLAVAANNRITLAQLCQRIETRGC